MPSFAEVVKDELERRGASPIKQALDAGLNRDAIRSVLRGRVPSVDRAPEICDALGLEFYVGPPRALPEPLREALGLPADADAEAAIEAIERRAAEARAAALAAEDELSLDLRADIGAGRLTLTVPAEAAEALREGAQPIEAVGVEIPDLRSEVEMAASVGQDLGLSALIPEHENFPLACARTAAEFPLLIRGRLAELSQAAADDDHLPRLTPALPKQALRSVLAGDFPRLDLAVGIAASLGLEFFVGPRELMHAEPPPPPAWLDDLYAKLSRDLKEVRDRLNLEQFERHAEVEQIAAVAGGGALELDETVINRIAFCRDWLDRHDVDPTQCSVMGVEGEDMAPTLPDGCSIMVDRGRRRRLVGHVYVVRSPDNGLVVKRMDRDDCSGWVLRSDHPKRKTVPWPRGAEIIGEVRWLARTLRL